MGTFVNPVAIFGDVHGDVDKLRTLIGQVRTRFGPGPDLYGLGDFVDRGPDSRGVIDLCIAEGVQG